MGPIGAQEMALIFVLALMIFGPKKFPELGSQLAKGLTEFRRAKNELKTTFDSHMQELEREARAEEQSKKTTATSPQTAQYSSATYPYPYDEYGRESNSASSTSPAAASPSSESVRAAEPVPGTVPRAKSGQTADAVSVGAEEHPRA